MYVYLHTHTYKSMFKPANTDRDMDRSALVLPNSNVVDGRDLKAISCTAVHTLAERIRDEVVVYEVADCKRASRAARAKKPSTSTQQQCVTRVRELQATLKRAEWKQAAAEHESKDKKAYIPRTEQVGDLSNTRNSYNAHLHSVQSKDCETHNSEPSWLLCGHRSVQMYDRLLENCIRANAVNASLAKQTQTQGAAYQTTRINCKIIGQAAAAQCVVVSLVAAFAEASLRAKQLTVARPAATNAVDPCLLVTRGDNDGWWRKLISRQDPEKQMIVILSTDGLLFNANPTKLGHSCILSAAKFLANAELSDELISSCVPSPRHMIRHLCTAVIDEGYVTEPLWASIVIVVYLCCDPRSRHLLASHTNLTDVDVQTAFALEAYGRGEITRRARLRVSNVRTTKGKRDRETERQEHEVDYGQEEEPEDDAAFGTSSDDTLSLNPDVFAAFFGNLVSDEDNSLILASKRRRGPRGSAPSMAIDSYGVLSWWYQALRSSHRSVIERLVSATPERAAEAALGTLMEQDKESLSFSDKYLQARACENATRCSSSLLPFVGTTGGNSVRWVVGQACTARLLGLQKMCSPGKGDGGEVREYTQALHACCLAPIPCQPAQSTGVVLLWSEFTTSLRNTKTFPNVLEAFEKLACPMGPKAKRLEGRYQRTIDEGTTTKPLASSDSGNTRSFIAMRCIMLVRQETIDISAQLAAEACAIYNTRQAQSTSQPSWLITEQTAEDANQNLQARIEPLPTPSSRLAVGLRVNEFLRRAMRDRTRKNDQCRAPINVFHTESVRDLPAVMDSEPLPMAVITDFDLRYDASTVEASSQPPTPLSVPRSVPMERHMPVSTTLHVCLDGAVRAPEIIRSLAHESTSSTDAVRLQRAVLYSGASQASFIGDLAMYVSASSGNTSISCSKRIATADVSTLCLLSIWDVYGGGLTNIRKRFSGTAYLGTYGPTLDTGITSVGLSAHYVYSDQRGHGSMTMSSEVADELAEQLTRNPFVFCGLEDSKAVYAIPPDATRGIPNGYTPGLHSVLNDTAEALQAFYDSPASNCRSDVPVLRHLFALPYSPFTQALRPDVESTTDPTLRHCFRDPSQLSSATGKSYIPDATSEYEAIIKEPLWRRPCQASSDDNPFATSYEYADTLFNALNTLAVIARECGGVDALHALITDWHEPCTYRPLNVHSASYQWAADACVLLFGAIYPFSHVVAEDVVPDCYARACVLHARRSRDSDEGVRLETCFEEADEPACLLEEARQLWRRFRRTDPKRCPWQRGIAPMLRLILKYEGSHDLSRDVLGQFSAQIDEVASCCAWLAYSEDGTSPPKAPNPAAVCVAPEHVRAPTLDPVFAAYGDELEYLPRGCLVGLKPFQLRQLYALLLGAHLPGVLGVQVMRNEGGLLLRESALPTVLERDGAKRSSKGISYVQIENDHAAYGNRKAKCYGAVKQKRAWDRNVRLCIPLFKAISAPRPSSQRNLAEYGDPEILKHGDETNDESSLPRPTENAARMALRRATISEMTKKAHSLNAI